MRGLSQCEVTLSEAAELLNVCKQRVGTLSFEMPFCFDFKKKTFSLKTVTGRGQIAGKCIAFQQSLRTVLFFIANIQRVNDNWASLGDKYI